MALDSFLKKLFVRAVTSAFTLQIIGFIVPGWLIMKEVKSERHFSFSIGLWFMVFCEKIDKEGTCEMAMVRDVISAIPKDSWSVTYLEEVFDFAEPARILSSISLIACSASIFLLLTFSCGSKEVSFRVAILQTILLSVSGILILVVVGYFTKWNMHLNTDVVKSKTSEYEVILPWCLMISALGGVVALIAAVVPVVRGFQRIKVVVQTVEHELDTIEIRIPPRKPRRVPMVDMSTNTPELGQDSIYYNLMFFESEETGDVVARVNNPDIYPGINPSS